MRIGSKFVCFGIEFEVQNIIVKFNASKPVTKIICLISDGSEVIFNSEEINTRIKTGQIKIIECQF